MWSVPEISRKARWCEVYLGVRTPPEPAKTKTLRSPLHLPDWEQSQVDVLRKYWDRAIELGINPKDERLYNAINGHPHRIEDAFLCLLEYQNKLENGEHATNFLTKALVEGWKPHTIK